MCPVTTTSNTIFYFKLLSHCSKALLVFLIEVENQEVVEKSLEDNFIHEV